MFRKNSLAVLCVLVFCAQAVSAQDSSVLCVQCNNEGVKTLVKGEFEQAIQKLEECCRLFPSYDLARQNLALAYNNYAVSLNDNPQKAMENFQKALALDNTSTIQANICNTQIYLGELKLASGDGASAIKEALAVLNNQGAPDPAKSRAVLIAHFGFLRSKNIDASKEILEQAKAHCNHNSWPYPVIACLRGDISEATLTTLAKPERGNEQEARLFLAYRDLFGGQLQAATRQFDWVERNASPFWKQIAFSELKRVNPDHILPDVNYDAYMANLQSKLKGLWHPPKGQETRKVKVHFKVFSDGTISNLTIANSSGSKELDELAVKAVKSGVPFAPLPKGSPDDVDIDFNFDYNVFK